MPGARVALLSVAFIAAATVGGVSARPLSAVSRLGLISRTAETLALQLQVIQEQLSNFASSMAPAANQAAAATAPAAEASEVLAEDIAMTAKAASNLRRKASSSKRATVKKPKSNSNRDIDGFREARKHVYLRMKNGTFKPNPVEGERSTVLLLANGKQYTQRWNYTETSNTVKVHASRQLEDRHRRQAFAGRAGAWSAEGMQEEGCDGCLGADTRTPVAKGSKFPWSAVGQLTGFATDGSDVSCSGALVSEVHVLTAAHCVWDIAATPAGPMSHVKFAAGMDGSKPPFGDVSWASVRLLNQFKGAAGYDDTAANNDFALITLSKPVGQKAGWLGLEWANGKKAVDLSTAGYPADKEEGTMWSTTCPRTSFSYVDASNNIVQHTCDSTHGQSGSAMFDTDNNVRAVLTGGGGDSGVNSALQVNHFVFRTLLNWMQEDNEFMGAGDDLAAPPLMELGDSP